MKVKTRKIISRIISVVLSVIMLAMCVFPHVGSIQRAEAASSELTEMGLVLGNEG
mgnify:CR=1 FL=1